MTETTFVDAAQTVTAPDYRVLPFDEDFCHFQEGGRALAEVADSVTPEEFDEFCRSHEWIGGDAATVRPLLDILRRSEEDL